MRKEEQMKISIFEYKRTHCSNFHSNNRMRFNNNQLLLNLVISK